MAFNQNNQGVYTSILKPGEIPPIIGTYVFNTRNTQSFDISHHIPDTAREISVTVFMRSGREDTEIVFNVWLWTELEDGQKDIKFKRCQRYPQGAFSTDSETFNFSYSSKHPKLYLMSDVDTGKNMLLQLFAVGYKQ